MKDFSFYIGFTEKLRQRLQEHNQGLSKATKSKRPWLLVYAEVYRSKKDALARERKLKKHKGAWVKIRERIKNSVLARQS